MKVEPTSTGSGRIREVAPGHKREAEEREEDEGVRESVGRAGAEREIPKCLSLNGRVPITPIGFLQQQKQSQAPNWASWQMAAPRIKQAPLRECRQRLAACATSCRRARSEGRHSHSQRRFWKKNENLRLVRSRVVVSYSSQQSVCIDDVFAVSHPTTALLLFVHK